MFVTRREFERRMDDQDEHMVKQDGRLDSIFNWTVAGLVAVVVGLVGVIGLLLSVKP